MEKMLLSAFQSAPNVWIPGVKADGTLVTCRFGIIITLCPEDKDGNLMGQRQNKNAINKLISPCTGATPEPDSVKILYNFNPKELGFQINSQNRTRPSTQKDSQYTGMIGKTSTTGPASFSMYAVQPYHPFASVSPLSHDTKNSSTFPLHLPDPLAFRVLRIPGIMNHLAFNSPRMASKLQSMLHYSPEAARTGFL